MRYWKCIVRDVSYMVICGKRILGRGNNIFDVFREEDKVLCSD